jgi:hypothetical protein
MRSSQLIWPLQIESRYKTAPKVHTKTVIGGGKKERKKERKKASKKARHSSCYLSHFHWLTLLLAHTFLWVGEGGRKGGRLKEVPSKNPFILFPNFIQLFHQFGVLLQKNP